MYIIYRKFGEILRKIKKSKNFQFFQTLFSRKPKFAAPIGKFIYCEKVRKTTPENSDDKYITDRNVGEISIWPSLVSRFSLFKSFQNFPVYKSFNYTSISQSIFVIKRTDFHQKVYHCASNKASIQNFGVLPVLSIFRL